ncbi:synembryn-A-like isoform X2 [Argiope bruennichi]|uniref:synembryn-A-like isoform X2 n=1 Tax=Argiope bruennichi TaxID=94029 RepID=UPI002493FA2C|nr:synembryn-A-like isoform X2 [Argiope bruennichi]
MDEITVNKLEKCSENEFVDCIENFNKKNSQSFVFPDLGFSLKKRLISLLFSRLSQWPDGRISCLEAIRILGRDKVNLDQLFTRENLGTLVNLAGLVAEEEEIANHCTSVSDPRVIIEAQKCLCNLIYNCSLAQKTCSNNGCVEGILLRLRTYKDPNLPHEIKFFDMRMLFLLTALCAEIRPKVRDQLHGLTYLMEVLDLILKDNVSKNSASGTGRRTFNKGSRRGKSNQGPEVCTAPCLSDEEVDTAVEVLKVLFNLTVNTEKFNLEEEEEAHYLRLVSILHDILLSDTKNPEKRDVLQSHTVDLLTNMPVSSYEELMTPVVKMDEDNPNIFEGMDMEAVHVLLQFLERRVEKTYKTYREPLSPILTTLVECSHAHSTIRKFLKKKVLPPLKDFSQRPEEGTALRNRLVKLMTSPAFDVKELVADFLFVLCKENVTRLIKYTGYGNAAGLLAKRGLMLGGNGDGNYSSDSEDSDTEEYIKMRDKINPVVGCYQERKPNHHLDDLTEEQREYEAMQLVDMMDKLAREGSIRPMRIGEDGKPIAIDHILEMREDLFKNKD